MSGSSPQSATTPSTPIRITSGHTYKRRYRPYFTKRQLSALLHLKQPGSTLASKEISARNSSCKFMEQVGKKLGLYDIAWGEGSYKLQSFCSLAAQSSGDNQHRASIVSSILLVLFNSTLSPAGKYILTSTLHSSDFFSLRRFKKDISVTCLYVASKIEETHKKLKDIFVAVYSVRYPDSKELDPEHVSFSNLSSFECAEWADMEEKGIWRAEAADSRLWKASFGNSLLRFPASASVWIHCQVCKMDSASWIHRWKDPWKEGIWVSCV